MSISLKSSHVYIKLTNLNFSAKHCLRLKYYIQVYVLYIHNIWQMHSLYSFPLTGLTNSWSICYSVLYLDNLFLFTGGLELQVFAKVFARLQIATN